MVGTAKGSGMILMTTALTENATLQASEQLRSGPNSPDSNNRNGARSSHVFRYIARALSIA
jgi:hypothetical protein